MVSLQRVGRPVFRVQDAEGRGPYRPGLTCLWADADGADQPTIFQEFGEDWLREIPAGWAAGCAFATAEAAAAWFTPSECARLALLGFHCVSLDWCRLVRASARQMIIARATPLRRKAYVHPWPHRPSSAAPARLAPWRHIPALG